mmetsp:Transcript_100422/g.284414  ORF Transcript_100422/g.284414 Transcript_100422/m.284414 type:complete len:263 (+) Transcript_100422:185-973(+)
MLPDICSFPVGCCAMLGSSSSVLLKTCTRVDASSSGHLRSGRWSSHLGLPPCSNTYLKRVPPRTPLGVPARTHLSPSRCIRVAEDGFHVPRPGTSPQTRTQSPSARANPRGNRKRRLTDVPRFWAVWSPLSASAIRGGGSKAAVSVPPSPLSAEPGFAAASASAFAFAAASDSAFAATAAGASASAFVAAAARACAPVLAAAAGASASALRAWPLAAASRARSQTRQPFPCGPRAQPPPSGSPAWRGPSATRSAGGWPTSAK